MKHNGNKRAQNIADLTMEIEEIKKQIEFIGESVIETCRRQRGGFDFLEN